MDVITVTDIEGLIKVSEMSESDVREYVLNAVERQYPPWSTINEENAFINRIVYGFLNEKQRKIFDEIHYWLNNRNSEATSDNTIAMLLDAPSGTGKTWLLMSLLITMHRNDILFLVYQRTLSQMAESIANITAYTCARSVMQFCDVSYNESEVYFHPRLLLENFRKIILTQIDLPFKFIILDEYTVVSPWYLLLVYWVAKQNGACVLYCGDRLSLDSMHKSYFHDEGNCTIVEALASNRMFLDLDQERIRDNQYEDKVNEFKDMLTGSCNNLDMTTDMKHKLYQLFLSHFLQESDISATYVGQFHWDLYRRAREICWYYETMGIECYRSPYYLSVVDANGITSWNQMQVTPNGKFLEFLPLIKGYVYYHINSEGRRCLVKYLERRENKVIVVEDVKTGLRTELFLEQISLDYYVSQEYEYLKNCAGNNGLPYQYPLRLRLRTYHSIQGHSIQNEEKIELNIGVNVSNCVYVGLSHVREESQLGRLHDIPMHNFKKYSNVSVKKKGKSSLVKLAMYLRDADCSRLSQLVRTSDDNDILMDDINNYLIGKGEDPL